MVTVPIQAEKLYFSENCDHDCSFNKNSKIRHFYKDHGHSPNKDCDHGRTPIKTQKYDIFVSIAIMVTILIKRCNHGRYPTKTQKHDIFVRTALIKTKKYYIFVRIAIMVVFLYVPAVHIFEAVHFLRSDYCGIFASFVTKERFCT